MTNKQRLQTLLAEGIPDRPPTCELVFPIQEATFGMEHGGVAKRYVFSTSNCIFDGMPRESKRSVAIYFPNRPRSVTESRFSDPSELCVRPSPSASS